MAKVGKSRRHVESRRSRILAFLRGSSGFPIWAQLAGHLIAISLAIAVPICVASIERRAQAVIEEVRTFDTKAAEFSVPFSAFVLKQIEGQKEFDETRRQQVIENLQAQHSLLERVKDRMAPKDREIVDGHLNLIVAVLDRVRSAKTFDDVKGLYSAVARLLASHKDLIALLRTRAGIAN